MNGAHDMGGRAGFGAVLAEANEPVFHAVWEARTYGMASALGGFDLWNLDEDRHACENRRPDEYVASSYYEIWLHMLENMLVKSGVISTSELAARKSEDGAKVTPRLLPSDVWQAQIAPGSYHRDVGSMAAFTIGQRVRVKSMMRTGHTRLPAYLRGVIGEIIAIHGCHVFPDSNAHGQGEDPRWLYGVRFAASEVWGTGGMDQICADMWEPYLEPA